MNTNTENVINMNIGEDMTKIIEVMITMSNVQDDHRVKEAIETREAEGDNVRKYALNEYQKEHNTSIILYKMFIMINY